MTDGSNEGVNVPTSTDIESIVDTEEIAKAANPSAAATSPILIFDDPRNIRLFEPSYDISLNRALTTAGPVRPIPCHAEPSHRATPPKVPVTLGNEPPTNSCDPAIEMVRTTAPVPNCALNPLNAENVPDVVL